MEEHVETFLSEFRMIIPGLAALLGFQLTAAFQQSYESMDAIDKGANFAGVCCSAAALMFLIIPAAYHRFIGDQEATTDFLRFARVCIGFGLAFLPLALAFALYMQAVRTFDSRVAGVIVGGISLAAFVSAWWVVPPLRSKITGKRPKTSGRA